ncbi:scavenger receptor cysteine-rich domain-containing group B protein [Syngnathoides biaculeatus]|uniref:scavenger receptor cysteine-rich domain-containing group B protein n=1 Tax=Syngnathoides biaculeatus TaxID=300417 RepID=UPI002ADE68F9|nr:scavenger receptor cysteine-rich domain-containing group B protein [Syngnathoides biaculeatus]
MVSQETMRGQRVLETMYKSLNPSIWILVTLLGSFVFMAFGVRLDDELQFLQRKHYQVKLANGQNRCEGRVEVYYNGTWGTVCDDEWDMLDAQVICRQLDCGIAVALGNSTQYAQTSIPIVLDNVDCNGSETNLGYCDSLGWGIHNCYHYEDVTIKCREPLMVGAKASGDVTTPPPKNAVVDGTVRLVGGIDSCQGRVEIYYQGHWGTVCDDDWDTMDAMVVCRQLGCAQVLLAPIRSFFGHGTGDILLDNVNCMGLEEQLSQCPHRGWRNHNCHHHEDAGIICSSMGPNPTVPSVYPSTVIQGLTGSTLETPVTNVDVTATEVSNIRTALPTKAPMALRVVSKYGSCQGRVEVQYNNVWGTVCDDGWDMPNAIVVCRQLGCGAAIEAKSQAAFGSGSGPILLDNVQCTGTETHLSQCIHSGVGQHNCAHHEDAGVICTPINPSNGLIRDFRATDEMAPRDPTASTSSTEGKTTLKLHCAVRLVDGEHECEGRVEMYLNSEWGTVCDDAWDIPDANVVCRQVGCGEAIAAWGEAHFGQGTGTVLFDNLKCNGREVSLQNCSHIDWNMHNCDHSEDAGVTCSRS